MNDQKLEPWMPAPVISPGAPVATPDYVPFFAQSKDPRSLGQKLFGGSRPTVPQGWNPASDYLPKGTKTIPTWRGIQALKNPNMVNGPQLNPGYLNKAKIVAGDWVSNNPDGANHYARGGGKVLTKNLPVKDLYVPNQNSLMEKSNKPMFGPNHLNKVRYIPPGTPLEASSHSNSGGNLGQTARQVHTDAIKAKAHFPDGPTKPMAKPGMMTGRMPGRIGGGLAGLFHMGPITEAKMKGVVPGTGHIKYQQGL
ncbi:MAG: hypothetical protein CL532_01495 [Aestuariivita sp.]|nr:hypothetical protein [Aestuariivita sp.]